MKKSYIIGIVLAVVVVVVAVVLTGRYLQRRTPLLIQGTVECTTYKASSKVPGRIESMKVREGERVTKGQLLYTLSTPELNAKLLQAEALRSAAEALDKQAVTGARKQQKEAALNLWKKAQAGLELAEKTYERVKNLYDAGVVPAQKLDEARANYEAMKATELAAAHSPTWWTTVPARRTRRLRPPRCVRLRAPWTRWSPTSAMRWSIRPSRARFRP